MEIDRSQFPGGSWFDTAKNMTYSDKILKAELQNAQGQ